MVTAAFLLIITVWIIVFNLATNHPMEPVPIDYQPPPRNPSLP